MNDLKKPKSERMLRPHIRWMIRRDLPRVLEIEAESQLNPWLEEDFMRHLRRTYCIGMVADDDSAGVVGFFLYELRGTRIELLNMAVAPDFWRRGIGGAMINKLIVKLDYKRSRIVVDVRETNLVAQQFFRACGFRAISIMREFYDDEDAYLMQYRRQSPPEKGSGEVRGE